MDVWPCLSSLVGRPSSVAATTSPAICSATHRASRTLSGWPLGIRKGSGSHVHCPRPCSSTCRWAKFSTHRHRGPHSVCNPRTRAHLGLSPPHVCHRQRDCGCLRWLAHAKKRQTFLRRRHISAHRFSCLIAFMSENHDSVATRVFRSAGPHLHWRVIDARVIHCGRYDRIFSGLDRSTWKVSWLVN